MMHPAIVIPAHNRPKSLRRLLNSLAAATYPSATVALIISVDPSGPQQASVRAVADAFAWPNGTKQTITHSQQLGLIANIFLCARFSQQFGSVILLEDDNVVGPHFYDYAQQTLTHFNDQSEVGGISLNALWFNGYTLQPFEPLLDSFDTYFLQVSWYQGMAFTAAMWRRFEQWLAADTGAGFAQLPAVFGRFPPTDWFPTMMRYLVTTGRTFALPRQSHVTNFGDVGTHFTIPSGMFQTPLAYGARTLKLPSLAQSTSIHDAFFEPLAPACLSDSALPSHITSDTVCIDLNGTKTRHQLDQPHVLTIRPTRTPIKSWGLQMRPPLANVVHNVEGNTIHLAHSDQLSWSAHANRQVAAVRRAYHQRPALGLRQHIKTWLQDQWLGFGRN